MLRNCSCVWLFWWLVSLTRRQQFKERVGRVCGVQSDFLSPFPHSGGHKYSSQQSWLSAVVSWCLIWFNYQILVLVQLLLSLPCPLPGPTSPFPHPNYSSPSSNSPSSKYFLSYYYASLCCVVLYCFEQNQSRDCLFIVHGHVWKDLELFIKIGISYFSN